MRKRTERDSSFRPYSPHNRELQTKKTREALLGIVRILGFESSFSPLKPLQNDFRTAFVALRPCGKKGLARPAANAGCFRSLFRLGSHGVVRACARNPCRVSVAGKNSDLRACIGRQGERLVLTNRTSRPYYLPRLILSVTEDGGEKLLVPHTSDYARAEH